MLTSTAPNASADRPRSWMDPWLWILAGAACGTLALSWLLLFEQAGAGARAFVLFLSLLAAGAAIVLRPGSAAVVGSATAVGFLGWLALGPWPGSGVPWDSARYMVVFLTGVAALAAVLLLLPRGVRRACVSCLILFHFGGIVATVFSIPPAPWLATNIWTYVSRPYQEFMYVNNAYHFYSPDPGPPNLLWFLLEYEDGSKRWYKTPDRDEHPTALNYQRRLSLTESTHAPKMTDAAEMLIRQQARALIEDIIPKHPGLPEALQFREPNAQAKRMIQNYARWVAQNDPLAETPRKVVRVRFYRVIHEILNANEIAAGYDPLDMWRYRPFYQGTFNAEGNLLDADSALLYWLVPIIRKDPRILLFNDPHNPWSQRHQDSVVRVEDPDTGRSYEVYDFLKVHIEFADALARRARPPAQ